MTRLSSGGLRVGESAQTRLVSHCASVVVCVFQRTCAAGCMFSHEETTFNKELCTSISPS